MRKYILLATFLLMIMLATILYGENDDQPKWNITLFGSYFLGGRTAFGIGGAVDYRLTPRLNLEGEVYSEPNIYGVSGGLLYNFNIKNNKTIPYVLVGYSQFRAGAAEVVQFLMFSAGIKMSLTRSFKIRLDFRLYLGEGLPMRLSTGLMWSF